MNSATNSAIFTVGHSNQSLDDFIALLRRHSITAVADVRSSPFSRVHPQFSREFLADALRREGISYVFLGRELGARSLDPSCYVNGKVSYSRLAETTLFRRGLERVLTGSRSHRLALVCAERDPLNCHRAIIISRKLEALGAHVTHIHGDGRLETQTAALDRLLLSVGLGSFGMFESKDQQVEEACKRQEALIAYEKPRAAAPIEYATE